MIAPVLPDHMDRWTHNRRLYETLKRMGLYVSSIPEPDDPTRINSMVVSADLPFAQSVAENAAEAGVGHAMERPHVGKMIGATEGDRDNVVLFPSVG